MAKTERQVAKVPRTRSPNFPALNLKIAVELVSRFYETYKKHETPIGLAHELWGYQQYGSAANRMVAAIGAYGLIETSGVGKNKKVKISEEGKRICGGAPDHEDLLKRSALLPPIHLETWTHYDGDIPNDELLKNYFLWEHKPPFNKLSVSSFISEFRETISFAKLDSSGIIDKNEAKTEPPKVDKPEGINNMKTDLSYFDLPLMLINGDMATLRVPRQMMSEENFGFMKTQLDAYKSAIVRKPEQVKE